MRRGSHYKDLYGLDREAKPPEMYGSKVKKEEYGWWIQSVTPYCTVRTTRLTVFEDGTAKAVTKVSPNYARTYQTTKYFDEEGREIVDSSNSTRSELAEWKRVKETIRRKYGEEDRLGASRAG